MKKELGVFLAVAVLGGLVYWLGRSAATVAPEVQAHAGTGTTPPNAPLAATVRAPVQLPPVAAPVVQAARSTVPAPAVEQSQPAEISMADARVNGDPRTPPIAAHMSEQSEAPTAAERADPKLYQQYEQRQADKGYAAYVKAADEEIPKLQQLLAQAQAQGATPEQLADGEEKLRRMTAMRDQLMSQHPEIARPDFQTASSP